MKLKAADLGFDACGIAPAGAIDPDDRLGAWLKKGFNADMTWMATTSQLRRDVRAKLPGAQSVVVVARDYYSHRPDVRAGCGRVSRYAWGRDYHRVLRKPVEALARSIAEMREGARCYCSVDSGPVLEKFWAREAGIGWIGKNSLVIRPGLGSWLFLGVIITTAELAADSPMPDQCGSCSRCIKSCPTGAIVEPRTVDARRCVSYLTVENRGPIPEEIGQRLGAWVFGCDVCQDACPHNNRDHETSETDFFPRPGVADVDVDELLRMDNDSFMERFAGTPVARAKLDGMRRNAAVVMKNLRDETRQAT